MKVEKRWLSSIHPKTSYQICYPILRNQCRTTMFNVFGNNVRSNCSYYCLGETQGGRHVVHLLDLTSNSNRVRSKVKGLDLCPGQRSFSRGPYHKFRFWDSQRYVTKDGAHRKWLLSLGQGESRHCWNGSD